MTQWEAQIDNLKGLLTTNVRLADNDKLYFLLSSILRILVEDTGNQEEAGSITISDVALSVLEDTCTGKLITLNRVHQALLISIYTKIVKISAGYIVRSILTSMIAICSTKTYHVSSKECATLVISAALE